MSELYTESYKVRKSQEDLLMKKWEKALNSEGGIKDEHMARTTAILLENYMQHLKGDASLIAEDKIQSTNFKGVNLALLGLIRRAVPALVGSELVGIQAMPTPSSPLFYMSWRKQAGDTGLDVYNKGGSSNNEELFGYPGAVTSDGSYDSNPVAQADPYFSSSLIRNKVVDAAVANNTVNSFLTSWAPIFNKSLKVFALSSTGAVLDTLWFNATILVSGSVTVSSGQASGGTTMIASITVKTDGTGGSSYAVPQITVTNGSAAVAAGVVKMVVAWEYNQESNTQAPELGVQIQEFNLKLVRRMLRGKFSLDSLTDAKAYHGISLENELMEIMKLELMNEINREIIQDLRSMAGLSNSIDYNSPVLNNVRGNYNDSHLLILDTVNGMCAEILNQTRTGRGNFVVGNAVTLSFLDRVPGFVGSGVSYDGKGLSYAGQLGKRINFYVDPQFPKNELLVGYKGTSALDTGYIHAPYLPITSTPTLYDPKTGDPSKIFYTRYGKTYRDIDNETGAPYNAIFRGQFFYGRTFLSNFPTI